MTLWLLRHGHTEWNGPPRRLQGRTDVGLSARGLAESRALGARLPPVAGIVASPARRCRETVAAAFGAAPPPLRFDDRLWEIDHGAFAGLTEAEAAQRYPDEWRRWCEAPARARPGGGETLAEMQARVASAMAELEAEIDGPGLTLVLTHGGPIRVLLSLHHGRPLDDYHAIAVPNLACFGIARERGGKRLVRITLG